jgi:hypothetical protein
MKSLFVSVCLLAITLVLQVTHAAAQTSVSPASDSVAIEFSGFGGASGGLPTATLTAAFAEGLRLGGLRNITTTPGSSTKWLVGGSVGAGVGSRVLVTFDGSMNRLANPGFNATSLGRPVSISMRVTLFEYVGGVQYFLARGGVEPYLAAGIGVVSVNIAADSTTTGFETSSSESDATSNFGGGVRLYVGSSWGIRPDVRVVRLPDETFFRANVGVFYQLR